MYKLFVGVLLATAVVAVLAPKNKLKTDDPSQLSMTMQYFDTQLLGSLEVKRDVILGATVRGELSLIVLDSKRKILHVQKDAVDTSRPGIGLFSKAHLIYIKWPKSEPPCSSFYLATRDGSWKRYFQHFPITGGDEPPFLYAAFLDRQGEMSKDSLKTYELSIHRPHFHIQWSGDIRLTKMQREHLDKIIMKKLLGRLTVASITFWPLIDDAGVEVIWDQDVPATLRLSRNNVIIEYIIREGDRSSATHSADVKKSKRINDSVGINDVQPPPYYAVDPYPDAFVSRRPLTPCAPPPPYSVEGPAQLNPPPYYSEDAASMSASMRHPARRS